MGQSQNTGQRRAVKTDLFAQEENKYGPEYKGHLLEQYKLYLEGIERISDRRQQTNNYFVAINAAILSIIGLSIFQEVVWVRVVLAIVGILISVIFAFLIRSYKQLNTGKFAVLHEIEERLPLRIYAYEWREKLSEGTDKNVYYPFSHIEYLIPWAFGLIYIALIIYFI